MLSLTETGGDESGPEKRYRSVMVRPTHGAGKADSSSVGLRRFKHAGLASVLKNPAGFDNRLGVAQ